MTNASKQIEIQWMRMVAAIEVTIWHSDLAVKHFSPFNLQSSSYQLVGGLGVELFFIVSGYVICLHFKRYPTAASFLYARISRIFPMYWIFTSLVVVAYIVNPRWHLGGFDLTLPTILKSYLILPQHQVPILGVGWSLEHEMLFYASVAIFIGFFRHSRATLIGVPAALVCLGTAGFIVGTGPNAEVWDYHLCSPYMLLFAFGWLLCCVDHYGFKPIHLAGAAAIVLLVLIVWTAPRELTLFLRTVAAIGIFLSVIALRGRMANSRLNRGVSLIADASYSLYLSHWIVLSALGKALGSLSTPPSMDLAIRSLSVAFCVLVAIGLFRYLEKPIDARLRPRPKSTRRSTEVRVGTVGVYSVDATATAPIEIASVATARPAQPRAISPE